MVWQFPHAGKKQKPHANLEYESSVTQYLIFAHLTHNPSFKYSSVFMTVTNNTRVTINVSACTQRSEKQLACFQTKKLFSLIPAILVMTIFIT